MATVISGEPGPETGARFLWRGPDLYKHDRGRTTNAPLTTCYHRLLPTMVEFGEYLTVRHILQMTLDRYTVGDHSTAEYKRWIRRCAIFLAHCRTCRW